MENGKNVVQFYPAKDFKIPIDCLTQTIFSTDFTNGNIVETEIVESKKRGIKSKITIINNSGAPLTEFDRAVLNAAITEIANGNTTFSANIIFHHLGGGRNLPENMRRAILDSFDKLSLIRVTIEAEQACKKKIIDLDPAFKGTFKGYVLPTESLIATINGQTIDAIHSLKKGVSFFNSDLRDQIITCSQELLQAPIKATPRNIALNHYLLRRALSIKGSREKAVENKHVNPLSKSINIDELLKHCGVEYNRDRQKRILTVTKKILQFLIEKNIIKNFTFETKKGGKFSSIILEF